MSLDLALPLPDNLRIPDSGRTRTHLVDSDVYHICDRLKEVSVNLWLWALDPPVTFAGRTYRWSVTEMCEDGVMRLVKRYQSLDARIIEDIQRMLFIPFERRLAEAEKQEAKHEEETKQAEFEKLYETLGRPMWSQLEHDGFIQRSRSFAKRGVKPR